MKCVLRIGVCGVAFMLLPPVVAQNVRYPELRPDQLSPEQKAFAENLQKPPRNGNVNAGPFRFYMRSPGFGNHALAMSDHVRFGTSLGPRLFEFTILISARQSSSSYVWRAHWDGALKAGVDPSVPVAIAAGQRPRAMNADETIIYDLLTQLYRDRDIADATFNAAKARFGERGITDIVGLSGYYGIVAMAVVAMDAPTAPGPEPKLQILAEVFPK